MFLKEVSYAHLGCIYSKNRNIVIYYYYLKQLLSILVYFDF